MKKKIGEKFTSLIKIWSIHFFCDLHFILIKIIFHNFVKESLKTHQNLHLTTVINKNQEFSLDF